MANLRFDEVRVGDLLTEFPKYVVVDKKPGVVITKMIKFDGITSSLHPQEVEIQEQYVVSEMFTDVQYSEVKVVTRDDKTSDGSPGIRTIFESLPAGVPFVVEFKKADKALSAKAYAEALRIQRENAAKLILDTQKSKKGVADVALEVLKQVQENPILNFIPGEMRTLRGYKLTNDTPIDGKYDVMEVVVNPDGSITTQLRQVNINNITSLCTKDVLYKVGK